MEKCTDKLILAQCAAVQLLEIVKDFEEMTHTSEGQVEELCSTQLQSLWKCLFLEGGERLIYQKAL